MSQREQIEIERLRKKVTAAGGTGTWGSITGTLSSQSDLVSEFATKQDDLDVPSQDEAEAGTSTTERVWTAERVKQAAVAANSDSADVSGGTETTDATYQYNTFTSNGTLTVNTAGTVSWALVGGGGGGGASIGGGGGAGEVLTGEVYLAAGSYPIVIGAGGTGGTSESDGDDGASSTFNGQTATGGGGGGGRADTPGNDGASGGGAASRSGVYDLTGGTGSSGGDGGDGATSGGYGAGGGGGSGSAGGDGTSTDGGVGGSGTDLSAYDLGTIAGGGGGGAYGTGGGTAGSGTAGGGAGNDADPGGNGTDATANTGSGGGGGAFTNGDGGDGADGVFVARIALPDPVLTESDLGVTVQQDLDVVSQADAEAGTATDERVWTAERVGQAIAALETSQTIHKSMTEFTGGLNNNTNLGTRWYGVQWPDADSSNRMSSTVYIPSGWSTVDATIYWSTPATSGNMYLNLQLGGYGVGDDTDTAPSYAGADEFACHGTADAMQYSTISGISVAGGEIHLLSLIRVGADALDTLSDVVDMFGVTITRAS